MPIHNADIIRIFEEIADLLEIQQANTFRIRAYRNAARTLQSMDKDVAVLVEQHADLTQLPTIGKDLAAKIEEIVHTGQCQALTKLRQQLPASLPELLKIPGLGPKRVHALYHELDIHTPEQLLRAARDGRILALHGFGQKTVDALVRSIESHIRQKPRLKLAEAAHYAKPLAHYLQQHPGVDEVTIAGSYRRGKDTVGDIDLLVSAADSQPVMAHFTHYDEVAKVQSSGRTRASVVLKCGLQVDLRVVAKPSFGAALHYFTGSRSHNIELRRRAQQRGLKLNEYGVFRGDTQVAGATEDSVFKAVGLPWIPPELRENQGEIAAAEAGELPNLIELRHLQGDLHAHTRASDGHASLETMAAVAKQKGLRYLAITEHSQRLTVTHGLNAEQLRRQIDQINALNDTLEGITLLKGIEVDILEDGSLDLPDEVLGQLDLVIAAIHSKFHLSRQLQTERIIRAMQRPHFSILAHPTGRLLEQRDAYDVDMPRVIREARQRGCYLELNAHPERLDLLDTHCRMAKAEGVLISINSDAHHPNDFDNLTYGIGQARRGWLEKEDVLNTRSLRQVKRLLTQTL
ncbi:DNA polymerase/3'-5' exonuclease PolX [Aestuariicella hydrocarbonica]|uniref:DNA polymerase beta n=2 Tax=Pseudomaricurvus hydrocarbonicus TaxID=1470433 RepID=A0A9E5JZ73_9GAMM|nr:DNA polymerase/3'-5' exonuclease PolX [Aestuariicella hydrocarbonica]